MDTGQSNEERPAPLYPGLPRALVGYSLAPTLDSWYMRTWTRRNSLRAIGLGMGAPSEGVGLSRVQGFSGFYFQVQGMGAGARGYWEPESLYFPGNSANSSSQTTWKQTLK